MSLFRRRPSEADVGAAVSAALGHEVAYNHLQYGGGALSGTLDVTDAAAYVAALRTAYAALRAQLGADADRVVIYLSARTPDGLPLDAAAVGLPAQPTGRDIASA